MALVMELLLDLVAANLMRILGAMQMPELWSLLSTSPTLMQDMGHLLDSSLKLSSLTEVHQRPIHFLSLSSSKLLHPRPLKLHHSSCSYNSKDLLLPPMTICGEIWDSMHHLPRLLYRVHLPKILMNLRVDTPTKRRLEMAAFLLVGNTTMLEFSLPLWVSCSSSHKS
jgi:hypothetical protein